MLCSVELSMTKFYNPRIVAFPCHIVFFLDLKTGFLSLNLESNFLLEMTCINALYVDILFKRILPRN